MNARLIICLVIVSSISLLQALADPPASANKNSPPSRTQYTRDILPILSANCFRCHGPDEKTRKAGLRLDASEDAVKVLKSGVRAITPGKPQQSELVARIFSDGIDHMPPAKSEKQLKEPEKQLLKRWIEEGAEYQRHWAFIAPQRSPVPEPKTKGWARNPIDAFVLAKLQAAGLSPSPEADRFTLARRVAIDLTGLPPRPESVERFINDASPLMKEDDPLLCTTLAAIAVSHCAAGSSAPNHSAGGRPTAAVGARAPAR